LFNVFSKLFQLHQADAEIQRLEVPEDLVDEVAAQVSVVNTCLNWKLKEIISLFKN
jgi:hypothetical protein